MSNSEQDQVQNRITTITGFAGLLLGLLANTISTIQFKEFNEFELLCIRFTLSAAMLSLSVSFTCGTIAFAKINHIDIGNNDPIKLLDASYKWILLGIVAITYSATLIITKSYGWSNRLMGFFVVAMIYEYLHARIKTNKKNQPPTETTERST